MKKLILLSLLVLLVSGLTADSHFTGIFSTINNSATDVAFGNDSGTANIWNTSPLSVWSNPAKLGYHNGIAWGYSNDAWLDEATDGIYHTSSYISVGWKGIGIMLPMLSRKSKFGTVMDYGEQIQTDEDGNETNSLESYDSSTKYAIGVNLLQFSSNFFMEEQLEILENYGDLSIGYNYNKIEMSYSNLGSSETNYTKEGSSHSSGFGMIARISPFNRFNAKDKIYKLDFTAGIYYLNHEKTEVTFTNEGQSDPLPWGTNTAYSGKFSIALSLISALHDTYLSNFAENFISVYYSQDNSHLGEDSNPSYWGEGIEFTLFDLFSYRRGQYVDRRGYIIGNTEGFGINLNYKDTFQFQYNVAYFPGGGLQNEQTKSDFLVRMDFLKIYDLMY